MSHFLTNLTYTNQKKVINFIVHVEKQILFQTFHITENIIPILTLVKKSIFDTLISGWLVKMHANSFRLTCLLFSKIQNKIISLCVLASLGKNFRTKHLRSTWLRNMAEGLQNFWWDCPKLNNKLRFDWLNVIHYLQFYVLIFKIIFRRLHTIRF